MAITTLAQLNNLIPVRLPIMKLSSAFVQAGQVASHWLGGPHPAAGVAPGAAAVCDSTTTGALRLPTPGPGETIYITNYHNLEQIIQNFLLYDRLVHAGGFDASSTAVQTVNTPALPTRGGNGEHCVAWIETYATLGTSSNGVTVTVSYTNQAGTAGRTGTAFLAVASTQPGMVFAVALAEGDFGVRSVESIQLSATTGAVGNIGVTIGRRLPVSTTGTHRSQPSHMDIFSGSLCAVDQNACLAFLSAMPSTNATWGWSGYIEMVTG